MVTRVTPIIQSTATHSRITFGLFEADLKSGELWKGGYRVKLQGLPFKVLTVLLDNAGEVVSREDLQLRVWGPDVIVDFEHSLGSAVKKLREALGDSAENPRFIETLARRGYRFIAPVRLTEDPSQVSGSLIDEPAGRLSEDLTTPTKKRIAAHFQGWKKFAVPTLAFGFGVLLAGTAIQYWNTDHASGAPHRISQLTQRGGVYSPADPLIETLPASVTDGAHVFTSSIENGRVVLSQVSMSTGESQVLPLPSDIAIPEINGISPDGTKLLVRSHLAAASQQPLWVVPISGGSAFKVSNILAQDATWMPDGKSILYASGNQLAVFNLESRETVPFATVPGRAFWLRWSPDGKLLRFTIIDSTDHTSSLWEIPENQHVARPLLNKWSKSPNECCGTWTADGRGFVFEATQDGHTDLWKLNSALASSPGRVTNGPLNYEAPTSDRKGGRIFFVGKDLRAMLERYDAAKKQYVPQQDFLTGASRLTFSRDRRWVAWVDSGRLWRARVDGTDKVLLTPESMWVFLAAWSPDGTRLALMSRDPGQSWQIFTVSADGGSPERLLQQHRNLADPSFSADGRYLVFGGVPDLMGQENSPRSLEILELATRHVIEVPHSQGLFSPRWSPDGRYIAALTLDQKKVMLYDVAAQSWKVLAESSAADPVWSSDSKALYIHAYMAELKPIYRVSVPDGRMDEVANLKNFPLGNITQHFFSGLTPDNIPLVRTEISSGNLYTMDLNSR